MRLSPYLQPRLVVVDLKAVSNVEVIERMIDLVVEHVPGLDRTGLVGALLDREQQVSTGLAGGVAVPHATVEGLDRTLLAIGRTARPVDFGSLDGSPVRFVFLMLSPPGGIATHIRLLARIARLCSHPGFLDAMGQARDSADLLSVVRLEDERHV